VFIPFLQKLINYPHAKCELACCKKGGWGLKKGRGHVVREGRACSEGREGACSEGRGGVM
jgi:hypothetical protein